MYHKSSNLRPFSCKSMSFFTGLNHVGLIRLLLIVKYGEFEILERNQPMKWNEHNHLVIFFIWLMSKWAGKSNVERAFCWYEHEIKEVSHNFSFTLMIVQILPRPALPLQRSIISREKYPMFPGHIDRRNRSGWTVEIAAKKRNTWQTGSGETKEFGYSFELNWMY